MNSFYLTFEKIFSTVFAPKIQKIIEKVILLLAALGFMLHLGLIFLKAQGIIFFSPLYPELFNDPISAIYTPFSLILIYEIYLLLFYLPRSFTSCVSKQFEIISLIVIRKIFKDIPQMDLADNWMSSSHNLELIVDLLGFLILFLLIFLFNKSKQRLPKQAVENSRLQKFIASKKIVSVMLFGVLGVMLLSNLSQWILGVFNQQNLLNLDSLFFNQFFTLLILADVVILLISFRYTEEYSKLIRNTGFIIATILIRLSFSAESYLTMILILTGVSFAYLILQIFNAMEHPKVNSTA
jgi:hypothetical protein